MILPVTVAGAAVIVVEDAIVGTTVVAVVPVVIFVGLGWVAVVMVAIVVLGNSLHVIRGERYNIK